MTPCHSSMWWHWWRILCWPNWSELLRKRTQTGSRRREPRSCQSSYGSHGWKHSHYTQKRHQNGWKMVKWMKTLTKWTREFSPNCYIILLGDLEMVHNRFKFESPNDSNNVIGLKLKLQLWILTLRNQSSTCDDLENAYTTIPLESFGIMKLDSLKRIWIKQE